MSKTNLSTNRIVQADESEKNLFIKSQEEKDLLKKLKSEWKKTQKNPK